MDSARPFLADLLHCPCLLNGPETESGLGCMFRELKKNVKTETISAPLWREQNKREIVERALRDASFAQRKTAAPGQRGCARLLQRKSKDQG